MATPGGPESIGELRVDIVGDDSGLDAAIGRAKEKVEQAKSDIGGGGGGGRGGDTLGGLGVPAGGGDGGGTVAGIAAAGGLNTGAINGAAVGLFINQMIQVAEKFEQVGEKIGNAMFDTQKQQLELTQAVRLLSQTLSAQQALNDKKFDQQAAGVGGQPAGDFSEQRINELEGVNQGLTVENSKDYGFLQHLSNAAKKTAKYTGISWMGQKAIDHYNRSSSWYAQNFGIDIGSTEVEFETDTPREVNQRQIDENNASMEPERKARFGQITVGRRNITGNRLANAAEDAGVPFNESMRNSGNLMSPEMGKLLEESIRGQKELIQILIRRGTFQGREQNIREMREAPATQQGGG